MASGNEDGIRQAADIIAAAEALLICAGAGIGVDSGLPDFRGAEGFWNAYPPYRKLNLDFYDLANPEWFSTDSELAWGFYGHRLNLYRRTIPHPGFGLLLKWAMAKSGGYFVFTSNVDGQFQKAGFA
ncbi:MAG: NAD-dependent protein deacetylase, partial [Candidatus Aminicenantes bacterium]|nr:NAD-dependent protein deacetylase [Candidatus Aminicenantes bacterium]